MKSTGVLRRIDGLGRIVIPKEIRKNLKIRDGESLEIFINDDAVVLKKFSLMSDLKDIAQTCSDAVYDVIDANIIITDRDKIIAASGPVKKKYLDKNVSEYIEEKIKNRTSFVENTNKGIEISNNIIEECNYVISPVLVNSESVGMVIIFSNVKVEEFLIKSANFISKFLGKHLE